MSITLEERYAKYVKVFGEAAVEFKEWVKLKYQDGLPQTCVRLDLNIFPDTLESFKCNGYYLRDIVFVPTQVKLTALDLGNNMIASVVIPDEIKSIKTLTSYGPLLRLKLGGSAGTIEDLRLSSSLPTTRWAIPRGMTALKAIFVGCRGVVVLNSDMIALERFNISVDTKVINVPKELVALREIVVTGEVTKIKIPKECVSVEELSVFTRNPDFRVPQCETLTKLHMRAYNVDNLKIPAVTCTNLKELRISSKNPCRTLPKNLTKIERLEVSGSYINMDPSSVDKVPLLVNLKYYPNLKSIRAGGVDMVITGDTSNLTEIDGSMGHTITIPKKADLSAIKDMYIDFDMSVNIPDDIATKFKREPMGFGTLNVKSGATADIKSVPESTEVATDTEE